MKTPLLKFVLAGLLAAAAGLRAEVKLASPFTSHMVLQRAMKVPVWGTAAAGENVTVAFAGQQKTATGEPTENGGWTSTRWPRPPTGRCSR